MLSLYYYCTLLSLLFSVFFGIVPCQAKVAQSSSSSQKDLKQEMLAEIDAIYHTFELRYAPRSWKKQYLKYDLSQYVEDAKKQIMTQQDISEKDFQRIISEFFRSMCDFHVGIYFYSTESSTLPFKIAFAKDSCFVTAVDKNAPNYDTIPVQVGDQILSFDGMAPLEALYKFEKAEMHRSNTPTEHALAAKLLTTRTGTISHVIPQGEVPIEVYHRKTENTKLYKAKWNYEPEKISHRCHNLSENILEDNDDSSIPLGKHSFFQKTMSFPLFETLQIPQAVHLYSIADEIKNQKDSTDGLHILGNIATPLGASLENNKEVNIVSRVSNSYYKAYIYQNPKQHQIGYIRLPNYYGDQKETNEFAKIILQFQNNTDALVIDQVNNPGGYFFYMYALASLLTPTPLKTHPHKQSLLHSDIAFAVKNLKALEKIKTQQEATKKIGSAIQGFSIDIGVTEALANHCKFLISEWNRGAWITEPNPLMGITEIKPHPKGHYSKPIVILVNELSFSCADFMPAMLQDNKRATVLGTKTPGAGGYVVRTTYPNRFGISSYTCTGSLALRTDLVTPIENIGVVPDIEYTLTPEDYQDNFNGYYHTINATLEELIQEYKSSQPAEAKTTQAVGSEGKKRKSHRSDHSRKTKSH